MTRLRQILVVLVAVLAMPAALQAVPIVHNQTTLNWELITPLPNPGNPGGANSTDTLEFDITNGTNRVWTDYHFRFFNPAGSVVPPPPSTVSIANVVLLTNPFTMFSIDANNQLIGGGPEREALLTVFGGVINPGGSFRVQLDLTYNHSVDVRGRPSLPEPASGLLVAAGLLMVLGAATLRRGRAGPRVARTTR